MAFQKVIDDQTESITKYRDGLMVELHSLILRPKLASLCDGIILSQNSFPAKINFLKEIMDCNAYLSRLYEASRILREDYGEKNIRTLEYFLSTKRVESILI